jgi:tetratricopeptide (TPR) repeat protein
MVNLLIALTQIATAAVATTPRTLPVDPVADSARRTIEAAQFVADTSALDGIRKYLANAMKKRPNNPLLTHYAGYAAFRRVNLVPDTDSARTKKMLGEARSLLERSIALDPMPESYALLSSIIGRQIGYYQGGADTLVQQANNATFSALNLNSDNPRVWLMSGISAFYTLPEHGGGFDQAEKQLRRAIRFFEAENVPTPMPSWGHAEAWCWLGQTLAKKGKIAEAKEAYRRALEIEPEFGWVKYVLLPSLEQGQSST